MATKYWLGIARAVAQIATMQVTAYHASTTYGLEVNGVQIGSTINQGSVNATATALATAWNASTHAYATGITAAANTDTVTFTGDVAGVPFTVAGTVAGGTGTLGAFTTSTAATGPNHWDNADNWSSGTIPANSDDVIVADSEVPILWGLDQSSVTLDSLTIRQSYTGKIGLPLASFATVSDGSTTAAATEYRTDYLTIGADVISIGEHNGPANPNGATRIKLYNNQNAASETTIHNTAVGGVDLGLPAVRLLAAHASANLEVRSAPGGVGIGVDEPGETATLGTVHVSDRTGVSRVFVGEGVTYTNFRSQGGRHVLNAAATVAAVDVAGGELVTEGDFTITALTIRGGGEVTANHVKSGGNAITTATVTEGGALIGTRSTRARTWDAVNLDEGSLETDDAVVTVTTLDQPAGLRRATVTRA